MRLHYDPPEGWHWFSPHNHTCFSPCAAPTPAELVAVSQARGVGLLYVTDHMRLEGALRARDIAPALVHIGVEAKTQYGEVLLLDVPEDVTGLIRQRRVDFQELMHYAEERRPKGLVVGMPHPFSTPVIPGLGRGGFRFAEYLQDRGLASDIRHPEAAGALDGLFRRFDYVEINTNNYYRKDASKSRKLASLNGLCAIPGEDTHFLRMIGARAITTKPIHLSLADAINGGQINTVHCSLPWPLLPDPIVMGYRGTSGTLKIARRAQRWICSLKKSE